MLKAAEVNSLDVSGMKPWHLKLDVEFGDGHGNVSDHGTVEELWASATQHRVVYTRGAKTMIELRNGDGLYRSKGLDLSLGLLEFVLQQVVHPIPSQSDLMRSTLTSETLPFGKQKFDCVMAGQSFRDLASTPLGLYPTYCLDHTQGSMLRVKYDFGGRVVLRNAIASFQGKMVTTNLTVNEGEKEIARGKIVALQAAELTEADFKPTDELSKIEDSAPVTVEQKVMAKNKLRGSNPMYPVSAKEKGHEGSVVMDVIIGWDGRVRKLEVTNYPNGDLAVSAIAAASRWLYSPYLVNGEPVDCKTTITINYRFGS
jgi:TonB family protein